MHDGSITIWDPSLMFNNNSNEPNFGCICYEAQVYETPVYSLEGNPYKRNLIASGGASEVLILNIEENISSPQIFSPGSPNKHEGSIVSSVSWNKRVAHILASASMNGWTVVWDLKSNKPILHFQDNSNSYDRFLSLSWNPEIPTQIAIGYEDPKSPEIQIWDLRNPNGPVVILEKGETEIEAGITSVSWGNKDPSLIIAGSKDKEQSQVMCWNYKTGEIVTQHYIDGEINSIKWNDLIPGLYGVSTNDSIHLVNFESESYAPKWIKPPTKAIFSPNNSQFCKFNAQNNQISTYSLPLKHEKIIDTIINFEELLENDFSSELIFNQKNKDLIFSNEEKSEWEFLLALKKGKNEVIKLLGKIINQKHIGLDPNEVIKKAENYTGKTHRKKEEPVTTNEKISKRVQVVKQTNFALLTAKDAEGGMSNIQQNKETIKNLSSPVIPQKFQFSITSDENEKEIVQLESVSKNVNWNTGVERIIKENILVGNFEGALDCLLKCGRVAEALVLAHSLGEEIYRSICEKQKLDIARNYEVNDWIELVVLALSPENENWISEQDSKEMLEIMAEKMVKDKHEKDYTREAIICFILAKNSEQACHLWSRLLHENNTNFNLINTCAKMIFLTKLIDSKPDSINKSLIETAKLCQEKRQFKIAYKLLELTEENQEAKVLKDFLWNSNLELQNLFKKPYFPFEIENIEIVSKNEATKKVTQKDRNITRPTKEIFGKNDPTMPIFQPKEPMTRPPVNLKDTSPSINKNIQPNLNPPSGGINPPNPKIFNPNVPQNKTIANPFPEGKKTVNPPPSNIKEEPAVQPKITAGYKQPGNIPPPNIFRPTAIIKQVEPEVKQPIFKAVNPPPKMQSPKTIIPPPMTTALPKKKAEEEKISQKKEEKVMQPKEVSSESEYIIGLISKNMKILNVIESNHKRRMDLEKSLDDLFNKLEQSSMKANTLQNLYKLCKEFENGNINEVLTLHAKIAQEDWEPNKDWLKTLKRIVLRK